MTTFGFLVCQLFPRGIISWFTVDEELIDLSEHGMRRIMGFFPLVGLQMVSVSFFQSIGMAGKAIFLSLTRQLIFLLPCLLFLPPFYGTDGVWYSFPIADGLAVLVSAVLLFWQLRKFRKYGIA